MQIEIYSGFSKRHNSTKRPATQGTVVSVLLKDGADILRPVFELNTLDVTINYVKAFDQYYFAHVQNIDGHRCNIICELDYLATFKGAVGAYTGLIEFTSSSDKLTITDPRNAPTSLVTATPTTIALTGVTFNTAGTYILGVISDTASGATGVLDYYALSTVQMQQFLAILNDQTLWDQVKNQFNNVMDAIVSCIWVPITGIGSGPYTVHVGREALVALNNANKIIGRIATFSSGLVSLNFNSSSGAAGSGMTYLEKAPYCTGALYLPFVGVVPLDMDYAAFTKSIQINGWIDLVTGDVVYKVQYGAVWVSTYNGNLATKVPVAGASYDGIGVATGAVTAFGGILAASVATIATGGAGAPIGAAIAGGSIAAAKSLEFHSMVNGSNSSAIAANLGTDALAVIYQYEPAETDLSSYKAAHGMPYFEVANIGSLSGYVKCYDASVSIPGDGEEQDVVNGYLNSGFYYE